MSSGIYAYWDNVRCYYVYVGKDNKINAKKNRNYEHMLSSNYNVQQINKVLQNNPERYEYRVIMEGNYNDWELNQMEKLCIKSFKTFKEDYPERNVFNFTKGGDGVLGYKHSKRTIKKISEAKIGSKNPNYGNPRNYTHSKETKKRMSESHKGQKNHMFGKKHSENTIKKISENHPDFSGNNHPNSKYKIWDINSVRYNKTLMLRCNGGNKPKKVFGLKVKGKNISLGYFIDFTTPEIIHNLICEAIGDYNG